MATALPSSARSRSAKFSLREHCDNEVKIRKARKLIFDKINKHVHTTYTHKHIGY